MSFTKKHLFVLLGPTAIGKTATAIRLAKHFKTDILSSDSRQFFKEMTIGTAAPSEAELAEATHHFIHSHSIQSPYNAGQFERDAIALLDRLFEKHDVVVMVGGSGLYAEAVCKGLDDLPSDQELRQRLKVQYDSEGLLPLVEQLLAIDPEVKHFLDLQNYQRVIRALEICLSSGQKYSQLRTSVKKPRNFQCHKIALNADRSYIYENINQRVDLMVASGLIEEVRGLLPFKHLNALQTVGYQEVFDALDGKTSMDFAIEKIKSNTRQFAKRQLTWLRRDPDVKWFESKDQAGILDHCISLLSTS